jgi:hypothetical protein
MALDDILQLLDLVTLGDQGTLWQLGHGHGLVRLMLINMKNVGRKLLAGCQSWPFDT